MEYIEGQDFMEVLNVITSKNVENLDDQEIRFLRARRYYLTPGQLDKFAVYLGEAIPTPSPRPKVKRAAKGI
jgi:hypothetical protein